VAYETLLYDTDHRIATITLNRPDALNTIVPPMTDELEDAVNRAVLDQEIRVIVLRGAGRSFCGGFDFGDGFHHWDERLATDGKWDPDARSLAKEIGLVNDAVPFEALEDTVYSLAERLCTIPLSQLTAMKYVVNQA
jgi:enoyl-CoA hydratase/carnithine racemase